MLQARRLQDLEERMNNANENYTKAVNRASTFSQYTFLFYLLLMFAKKTYIVKSRTSCEPCLARPILTFSNEIQAETWNFVLINNTYSVTLARRDAWVYLKARHDNLELRAHPASLKTFRFCLFIPLVSWPVFHRFRKAPIRDLESVCSYYYLTQHLTGLLFLTPTLYFTRI